MNKIFALGVAAVALSGAPALADANNIQTTPLTGPYVGVYGGYNWTDFDGANADPDGWDGGVFAGYKLDALMDKDYGIGANGAIEAFYGVSNADDNNIEKDDEWGISFRPGISILDSMTADLGLNPYGILGYRNTKFESTNGGGSDRFNGFELGIGSELVAYGDFGIRAEYAHVWYASENGIDPDSDDLRLGVSYHF